MAKKPRKSPLLALGAILGSAIAAQLALSILGARSLAAEILAAFAIDAIAARLGAPWYGVDVVPSKTFRLHLRQGALAGFAPVAVLAIAGAASRQASMHPTSPSLLGVALALVTSFAMAVRGELLYRWLPLRLAGPSVPENALRLFAIFLGAAQVAASLPFSLAAILVALSMGALSVALIRVTKGLVASVVMHATLLMTSSTLLTSTLDLRWKSGSISPLDHAGGLAGYALAAALLSAAAWTWRRSSQSETPR